MGSNVNARRRQVAKGRTKATGARITGKAPSKICGDASDALRLGADRSQRTQNGLRTKWPRPRQIEELCGRWDRKRTGALRFWSLPPFIQRHSGTYTSSLVIACF